jgi:hypothetical protein
MESNSDTVPVDSGSARFGSRMLLITLLFLSFGKDVTENDNLRNEDDQLIPDKVANTAQALAAAATVLGIAKNGLLDDIVKDVMPIKGYEERVKRLMIWTSQLLDATDAEI